MAFWIGFLINTLIVELWLRSREGESQIAGWQSGRFLVATVVFRLTFLSLATDPHLTDP